MANSTSPVKSAPPAVAAPAPAAGAPAAGAPAGVAEPLSLKDVVATLVKNSKGKGMVTYDQLNALLPDAMNDPEQLDQRGSVKAWKRESVEASERNDTQIGRAHV